MFKIFYSVLFGFISIACLAQNTIKNFSNSVGLISFNLKASPGDFSTGTGTLIAKVLPDNGAKIFLITNKHVLPTQDKSDSIHFRIKSPKDKSIGYFNLSIPIFDKKGNYSKSVKFDPDGNDLAVIEVTDFFILHKSLGDLADGMVTDSFLARKDSLIRYDAEIGDEIFFIGYPNFLFDARNILPIVRTGIIATDPFVDFYYSEEYKEAFKKKYGGSWPEKLNGFLIDGNVFSGSSGSLIVTNPRIVRIENGEPQILMNPGNSFAILGILTISFYDLGSPVVERVQLGGVISSSQIIKTIELFKK